MRWREFGIVPSTHPSILALLKADGGNDPDVAIRLRARALVAEMMEIGWDGPPYDMEELASFRGFRVAESTRLAEGQDACITTGHILVNATISRARRRYSVAHEVAHTLFPDFQDELTRQERLWLRPRVESEFERLCQAAAAEFLMPLTVFEELAERCGREIVGIDELAERFGASLEAAARRAVETAGDPMAVLMLRPQEPDTGGWLRIGHGDGHTRLAPLAVAYSYANAGCRGAQFAHGIAPPADSAAVRAWKRVGYDRRSIPIAQRDGESWEHAGVPGEWQSEALSLPKGEQVPYEVLCVLRSRAGVRES